MGLENTIQINDDVIIKLIEEYTLEAGVRKLKEVLFEIISEINLEILSQKHIEEDTDIINISFEEIKYKYLKHRNEIRYTTIHKKPKIREIRCTHKIRQILQNPNYAEYVKCAKCVKPFIVQSQYYWSCIIAMAD